MPTTPTLSTAQARRLELAAQGFLDRPHDPPTMRTLARTVERTGVLQVDSVNVFARAHLLRTWAGIVDVCPDASPIVGRAGYDNLYLNAGWGTGGFKATPGVGWALAHTIATGSPHAVNAPFTLDRFVTGRLIDEHGAAAVAH